MCSTMDLYLAGGILGNLRNDWKINALGGGKMNLYLAGNHPLKQSRQALEILTGGGHKILESFYYCKDNEWIERLIPQLGDFLLDSGAFTFMQGVGHANWDEYTEEYAAWIVRNKVEKFIEMDIDSVVGLREVERLRRKLERLTNRQPIPVWHISRGQDYFIKMCDEYPYVAFGGLQTDGVSRDKLERAFPWFINTAHKHGAKIHGLGYTSIEGMHKYHFDSVDSTAWLYGNRGGYLYKFNPRTGTMGKIEAPPGHRLKSKEAALWNFNEWVKFQQYAEKYL